MSLKELWKLASADNAISVDSRGRVTVDRKKFFANESVKATVGLLRTHRMSESRSPAKKRTQTAQ